MPFSEIAETRSRCKIGQMSRTLGADAMAMEQPITLQSNNSAHHPGTWLRGAFV